MAAQQSPLALEITLMEVLVHLNGVLSVPLVLSSYDVSDGPDLISAADSAVLPEGWSAIPHGQASATLGASWLWAVQELGLVLPSVVMPPVALVHQEPCQLDQRPG